MLRLLVQAIANLCEFKRRPSEELTDCVLSLLIHLLEKEV
jgi:hypothetical protein